MAAVESEARPEPCSQPQMGRRTPFQGPCDPHLLLLRIINLVLCLYLILFCTQQNLKTGASLEQIQGSMASAVCRSFSAMCLVPDSNRCVGHTDELRWICSACFRTTFVAGMIQSGWFCLTNLSDLHFNRCASSKSWLSLASPSPA